jgi:sugar lactone lactonase YvrE
MSTGLLSGKRLLAITPGKSVLLLIALLAVLIAPIIARPVLRLTVKRSRMLRGFYLRYSKWRHGWRAPADVGDGRRAEEVLIDGPMGIGGDAAGNIYVSTREGKMIWKVDPSGKATVIAGSGMTSYLAKEVEKARVKALEADFWLPEGLVVDQDGNILLADRGISVVFKIAPDGWRTVFAGNGQQGYDGDGGLATEASLNDPYDVRLDREGNLYIADVSNNCIRKVDRRGVITTVAGTGVKGFSGDGGPAVNAQLNMPYGILLDREGNLLIADSENDRIRKVGRDGIITTIAGCGQRGYAGDGGPALAAKFDVPQSLALDAKGRLYIGDEHNHAIRVVEPDGTIRTLIGGRGSGFSGDGLAASSAQLNDPENMWVRPDGSLLISDRGNVRMRIMTLDGIINTWAGRQPPPGSISASITWFPRRGPRDEQLARIGLEKNFLSGIWRREL